MNSFDAAVYLGLVVGWVPGFNAGLLRSAVTILAYLIAISAMSLMSSHIGDSSNSPLTQNSLLLFGIFLIVGIVLGKMMRMALNETIEASPGSGDRPAGGA